MYVCSRWSVSFVFVCSWEEDSFEWVMKVLPHRLASDDPLIALVNTLILCWLPGSII